MIKKRVIIEAKTRLNLNIQQLRGMAVISVILFHLNLTFAKTGFLGVDVFFVISGFLMAMLYGQILSLKDTTSFYSKRSLRLLPAYWVTILAPVILTNLICLPHEISIVNKHGFWALFFMPNIGFWSDAEYWGGSQFRPFLHLWSLGVEFQFYLIYPLICKFFNTQFKRTTLMVISLTFYIIVNEISAKTAFFMMPTRLWQFLLGIIAFEMSKKIYLNYSNRIFQIVSIFLLMLMMLPIKLEYGKTILISIPASVIAAGAVFVCIQHEQNVKIGMVKKFLVWMGKYSFSMYLMHFPIILFLAYTPFGGTTTGVSSIGVLLVFIILLLFTAKFTHSVFERRIRNSLNSQLLFLFGLISSAIFVFFILIGSYILDKRFNYETIRISNAVLDQAEYRCGKVYRFIHPLDKFCLIGNKNYDEKYLLFGNSHADSIKNSLSNYLNSESISLYLNAENDSISDSRIIEIMEISRELKFSKVIFHSRTGFNDLLALGKLLPKLNQMGIQSYYILPVPELQFSVPIEMYQNLSSGSNFPYQTISDYLMYNEKEIVGVSNLSRQFGLKVLEPAKIFCSFRCEVADDKGLFYFDAGHLTLYGSQQLIPLFREILAN